jgi:dsRNA-specific ribonuclease
VARKLNRDQILKDAWIGDAVLTLYARRRILAAEGRIDARRVEQMTSNQFLNAFGEASEVEAEIGVIYERDGLAAAFAWIEAQLMPVYERQETNRQKRSSSGGPRRRADAV